MQKEDFNMSLQRFMGVSQLKLLLEDGIEGINSPTNLILMHEELRHSFSSFATIFEVRCQSIPLLSHIL